MPEKLYVIYNDDNEMWIDPDYSESTYEMMDKYFTDEDQAELCAEYLEMTVRSGDFFVREVTNGDNIDYKSLIEEQKKKMRIREEARKLESERRRLNNYALEKSRIEGGNWIEIYHDLLKQRGLE